jgi:hypothetical protein
LRTGADSTDYEPKAKPQDDQSRAAVRADQCRRQSANQDGADGQAVQPSRGELDPFVAPELAIIGRNAAGSSLSFTPGLPA